MAKSKKTSEDKEYELQEIAEGLYTFSTVAFVGKNASGKTSAIELLDSCYSILGQFRLEDNRYIYNNVLLEIIFFHEGYIYKYNTVLTTDTSFSGKVNFSQQRIYRKRYYKSKLKEIYSHDGFKEITGFGELPEDTSVLFFVLKKKAPRAVYFDCNGEGADTYGLMFRAMKTYEISEDILLKVIRIFDDKIKSLKMLEENRYELVYDCYKKELSHIELEHMLSSGTTKGVLLYIYVAAALKNGFDLLIDEVENHFHKTLVENIIILFKDKTVNKKSATLVFTTHYCELLDLFNRQDNIWIAKSGDKIYLDNMYERYNNRPELLKSRRFYSNAFDTAVNYDDLMALKKELMR
ncbi:MAG: ATP-binding protein [Deferribacterales bacterium]|nr:ATP-binding protein [Deferribacterales bacterium]